MTENIFEACIDRVFLPDYTNPLEAAANASKMWANGSKISVSFLDGARDVQEKIMYYANQWSQYANIKFEFGNDPKSKIRISFRESGSWSAIGTDCLRKDWFPPNTPTMNFGWLTPGLSDEKYSSVILHEFGHALGLIHEHQSPASGIDWNKTAVTKYFSGSPNYWDAETVASNIFRRYTGTQTQYPHTAFDAKSIMVYPIAREWTNNGYRVEMNSVLSQADKDFIRNLYRR